MTKIIINHLLNFKNKLFISIYFILVLLVFIIPLPFDSNSYEIILDLNFYKSNYNEVIIELLKLLTAISVLILAIDHNQGYINNITTFKERIKDRKSTRLNSSHVRTSYAVFCLKKKISK